MPEWTFNPSITRRCKNACWPTARSSPRPPIRARWIAANSRASCSTTDGVASAGWRPSTATRPFLGQGYLHDGNTRDGKTTIAFHVAVPAPGPYRVRVLYPPDPNRATRALVVLTCDDGRHEYRIDQRREASWIGSCAAAKEFTVTVSNEGADGYVVVDGLQAVAIR